MTGFAVAFFLEPQAGTAAANFVRLATGACSIAILAYEGFRSAKAEDALAAAGIFCGLLFGGQALAEAAALLGVGLGFTISAVTSGGAVWWTWRAFQTAPHNRLLAVWVSATLAIAAVIWFLARHEWYFTATGLTGTGGMALACGLGVALIRRILAFPTGIAAVARAAVDEALRQRTVLALLILFVLFIPILPLILDQDERLEYRLQFFLSWALGGTGLILALITIFLGCSSVCGDITSSRIHMTLAKPLHRGHYLAGKWLGIMCFNTLLLTLSAIGIYTFSSLLASTTATDDQDRDAVDQQILTARVAVEPTPKNPEEYEAAISAAIAQLEKDSPEIFAQNPLAARRRIRSEYRWDWHTVSSDMVSTFVFHGLDAAKRSGEPLQLQVKPRVNNVEVDLAEVRFAMWLNGRPWPMNDGVHQTQTLASLATHVLQLPSEPIDDEGSLQITIENKNLIPDGETTPTAITLAPGDGLRLFYRQGGFLPNFLRCQAIMLSKLSLLAATAVAAASFLGFPSAVLLSLVVYFSCLGSGFLRDSLAEYNMSSQTLLGSAAERLLATVDLVSEWRLYEAFRMFFGFVTDFILCVLPSFSDYDGTGSLTAGLAISTATVLLSLTVLGLAYPIAFGACGWVALSRRDLIPSSTS